MPVLKEKLGKIAIIGDSGCTLPNDNSTTCNSKHWPLVGNIASLSTHNPDLVIHLGDYNYKMYRCYHNRNKCEECMRVIVLSPGKKNC
ncbi:hypothetical protein [Wolbachia endosymbiont of Pentidionis agamae]|uniref:hypothetical protein n=1 Tax=Wolbachia endosymbiont of Pentidionis agamae TaxID=3110435 RepID=UPI002FD51042